MIHRLIEWPPLQEAFAILDSKTRRRDYGIEEAINIIREAQDGVRVLLRLRRDGA